MASAVLPQAGPSKHALALVRVIQPWQFVRLGRIGERIRSLAQAAISRPPKPLTMTT